MWTYLFVCRTCHEHVHTLLTLLWYYSFLPAVGKPDVVFAVYLFCCMYHWPFPVFALWSNELVVCLFVNWIIKLPSCFLPCWDGLPALSVLLLAIRWGLTTNLLHLGSNEKPFVSNDDFNQNALQLVRPPIPQGHTIPLCWSRGFPHSHTITYTHSRNVSKLYTIYLPWKNRLLAWNDPTLKFSLSVLNRFVHVYACMFVEADAFGEEIVCQLWLELGQKLLVLNADWDKLDCNLINF